jgi:hypothetical protein
MGKPDAILKLKREKLNGRLLYKGWILVWPDLVTERFPSTSDRFILKLAPGRLFSASVKHAVFLDRNFGISPKYEDIKFLSSMMRTSATPARVVKRKIPPRVVRYALSPLPERKALMLVSQLRFQDSRESSGHQAPFADNLSLRQAIRFMRYEISQDDQQGNEHADTRRQRDFYDRVVAFMNRKAMRSPLERSYSLEMHHWARTRWIVHDLTSEAGRRLRCEWYREHSQWGTDLDQLSLAFVLAQEELKRRVALEELDDRERQSLASHTETKRLLVDDFEWYPVNDKANMGYSPYEELLTLPYDLEGARLAEGGESESSSYQRNDPSLFVRVVSDRTMTFERVAWNRQSKHEST